MTKNDEQGRAEQAGRMNEWMDGWMDGWMKEGRKGQEKEGKVISNNNNKNGTLPRASNARSKIRRTPRNRNNDPANVRPTPISVRINPFGWFIIHLSNQ
jgi:hypothetical protein